MKSKYLVMTQIKTPRQPNLTHLKDYVKLDINMATDERVEFLFSVKNKHIYSATIILDIINKKIVKSRYGDKTYDELYDYFYKYYKERLDMFQEVAII